MVGGGDVAERKVSGLLKAGARVRLISPETTVGLREIIDTGSVEYHSRGYKAGDLRGASLAIAATDDERVNRAVASEAEKENVWLNVVDDPPRCTFIAPAVVMRGDLSIAVSTGGRSPAFARRVREELERQFPEEWAQVLEIVSAVREEMMRGGKRAPGDLWQRAISAEVMDLIRAGRMTEARDRLEAIVARGAVDRS